MAYPHKTMKTIFKKLETHPQHHLILQTIFLILVFIDFLYFLS